MMVIKMISRTMQLSVSIVCGIRWRCSIALDAEEMRVLGITEEEKEAVQTRFEGIYSAVKLDGPNKPEDLVRWEAKGQLKKERAQAQKLPQQKTCAAELAEELNKHTDELRALQSLLCPKTSQDREDLTKLEQRYDEVRPRFVKIPDCCKLADSSKKKYEQLLKRDKTVESLRLQAGGLQRQLNTAIEDPVFQQWEPLSPILKNVSWADKSSLAEADCSAMAESLENLAASVAEVDISSHDHGFLSKTSEVVVTWISAGVELQKNKIKRHEIVRDQTELLEQFLEDYAIWVDLGALAERRKNLIKRGFWNASYLIEDDVTRFGSCERMKLKSAKEQFYAVDQEILAFRETMLSLWNAAPVRKMSSKYTERATKHREQMFALDFVAHGVAERNICSMSLDRGARTEIEIIGCATDRKKREADRTLFAFKVKYSSGILKLRQMMDFFAARNGVSIAAGQPRSLRTDALVGQAAVL